MIRFIRHYLLAVQFFTRIPVTGRLAEWVGFSPDMLRASAAHFPGIGVLIGGAAAAVFALLVLLLPDTPFTPLVAAALSTVATVWLTGGFHEDGLADVADGPKPTVKHRFYHVPASNTAVGHLILENT